MPDADGDVIVDEVRIKEINLCESRRSISILGQSPVLFSGSVRENLDLMKQFQDTDLWRALEDVQYGANVSLGERQLILFEPRQPRNMIIILDEPTAHVDPDTEQTIWNVARAKLRDSHHCSSSFEHHYRL